MQLEFTLYIRKYKQAPFDELAEGLYPDIDPDDLNDEQIHDVVNRMDPKDIHVYKIEYIEDIDDDVDDFIDYLNECINNDNIYNKIHADILESNKTNDEKIDALKQLNVDKSYAFEK